MLVKRLSLLLLLLGLSAVCAWAQVAQPAAPQQPPQTLESGKPVEREIAGGESHTYQITLRAGQFVRFHLEQRAISSALILTAPDGKQQVEMDLTGAGSAESLSLEAATAGVFRLTVKGIGLASLRGSYRLEAVGRHCVCVKLCRRARLQRRCARHENESHTADCPGDAGFASAKSRRFPARDKMPRANKLTFLSAEVVFS